MRSRETGRKTRSVASLLVGSAVVAATALVAAPSATAHTRAEGDGRPSLHELAQQSGKYFAAAIDNPELDDTAYTDLITTEAGHLTVENAMKWENTEPQRGRFTFDRADEIVELAQQNDMTVRGHTLVWHSQTPDWVKSLGPTEMQRAVNNHIAEVAGRYSGELRSWDVVNEPLNEDGSLRESFFYETLGEDYIARAFRAAHRANPNAKLYINDYNLAGMGAKSDGMYRLVKRLLAQGVPIDGVGFQGHLGIQYPYPEDVRKNLRRFADLGLEVAVTELDVRMELPVTNEKLHEQATYYANMTDACLDVEACVGVTAWGMSDRHSWIPDFFEGQGAAHMTDEDLKPKPAYRAVRQAFRVAGAGTPRHGHP